MNLKSGKKEKKLHQLIKRKKKEEKSMVKWKYQLKKINLKKKKLRK